MPWAEDHFQAQNQIKKQQRLLKIYHDRSLILNVNPTYQSRQSNTEKHVYVEMNEQEYRKFCTDIDNLALSGGTEYEDIITEVFDYMRNTDTYFWSGWKRVTDSGHTHQLTLETSDVEKQQEFYNTLAPELRPA